MPIRNGVSPHRLGILAADQLAGADERGGPLELLRGEQPQRVAHDHGDAVAAVAAVDDPLEAPDRERERGQPEVGLGLAAAGREEQQVGEPGAHAVRVCRAAPGPAGSAG